MWTRSCFLLVAILGFVSWSMAANLPLRNADQQVLAKLSTTWAGLPASWNADNTTMGCDWPGIICGPDYEDSSFSAVWFISVNQVTGPLISDIANLASLTQFNAQFSDFQNTPFPSEFGTLVNLTMINAFNNKIGGPLPDLSACQKLSFLNLALNNLGEFPAWIVNVPSLTLVGLDSNSMTGTIPQDIGDKLTKLTDFDVSTNQLTGDVPISFTNAKKLTNLKLDNNKFNCLPDQPSSFDFLDFCNGLQFCTFTDPGCPQYLRLNDAQYLVDLINQWSPNCLPTNWTVDSVSDACNIPFQGVTCNALWQLSGLVLIAPENTLCISVPPPASLFNATYLSTLAISGYAFNGTIPSTFSTTNIAKISLTNQFLTDPIPPINKKKLTTLDLSRNFFTAPPKAEDLKNSSLTSLNLANNLITGDLSFVPQNQLSALNVSINSFTGDLSFFNFKSTAGNLIDVSFNQLTGSIPSQFISMDYSYAVFNDNQFTGSLDFEELHSSGNILNLSNNQLSGTLSPMIYRYFVVKADNNQFTGSIPEVSPTHYNNYLSLTNNSLTGNVPASLSNNTFTTTLQLDNNAGLEGVIPEEISELTLLSVFTFSGTKLTCPNTDSWNKWVQTVVEITCKKPDDNGTDWFLWGSVAGILVIVAILVSLLIFLAWRNQKKNSGQYETV